jgi:hypothetical protein
VILKFVIVIRRRQAPHVKETTEGINNKIYNNEEDVTLRTGSVPDREPYGALNVTFRIYMRNSMFDLSIKLEETTFGGVVLLNGTKDIIS